jgi:hypothetical protein
MPPVKKVLVYAAIVFFAIFIIGNLLALPKILLDPTGQVGMESAPSGGDYIAKYGGVVGATLVKLGMAAVWTAVLVFFLRRTKGIRGAED